MKQVIISDEDGKMMKSCNEYKSLNTTKDQTNSIICDSLILYINYNSTNYAFIRKEIID